VVERLCGIRSDARNRVRLAVIDPVEGRLVADIKTGPTPHGVDIAPDGKTLYVANEGNGTLAFIEPVKNEVTASISVGWPGVSDAEENRAKRRPSWY